jgi:hypothetical protein
MVSVRSTFTVSVKVAVRLGVLALVPVTVIVEVPPDVAADVAVMVSVAEQVGLHVDVENVPMTPVGRPATDKVTGWVVPARRVAVTTVEADGPPAVTVTVPGLTASE